MIGLILTSLLRWLAKENVGFTILVVARRRSYYGTKNTKAV